MCPNSPRNPDLDRRCIDLKAVAVHPDANTTPVTGQCRWRPEGRRDIARREKKEEVNATGASTTTPMAEDLALGHGNMISPNAHVSNVFMFLVY